MNPQERIARSLARWSLNGGDPDQPAVRWNGAEMEPQEFPAWHDYIVAADLILADFAEAEQAIVSTTPTIVWHPSSEELEQLAAGAHVCFEIISRAPPQVKLQVKHAEKLP